MRKGGGCRLETADFGGDGAAEFFMLGGVEVDAVVFAGGDHFLAVEVGALQVRGEGLVVPRQLAAAAGAVEELGGEVRQMGHVSDRGRADNEELGRAIARAGGVAEDEAG